MITVYSSRPEVAIGWTYFCGNLHRSFFRLFVRDSKGQWADYDNSLFESMSEAVVWVLAHGLKIENWEECKISLAYESMLRRIFVLEQVLPCVPKMIGLTE